MVTYEPAFRPYQYESVLRIRITLMRIQILLCRFDADPDPDCYDDADPDPTLSL
jgi:hypothetical protein